VKRGILALGCIGAIIILLGASLSSVVTAQTIRSQPGTNLLYKGMSVLQKHQSNFAAPCFRKSDTTRDILHQLATSSETAQFSRYPVILILFVLLSIFEFIILVEYFVALFFLVLFKYLKIL
jgi:hypothetical protein